MRILELGGCLALCATLGACAGFDHDAATALGTAGMSATQALSDQTGAAATTVGALTEWDVVRNTLGCAAEGSKVNPPLSSKAKAELQNHCADRVKADPDLAADYTRLSDALVKRKKAIGSLNAAYAAFVDLAKYNAGQDTSAALKTSFDDIDAFIVAASALPGGAALKPVEDTVKTAAGGVVALLADARQRDLVLQSNGYLAKASNALYAGLSVEQNAAAALLGQVARDRSDVYRAGLSAGIIKPTDILTPIFTQTYPGTQLTAPTSGNLYVIRKAAEYDIDIRAKQAADAAVRSYADALGALNALSDQHSRFATGTMNLTQIGIEVSNLQTDVAQMNAASKPATTTK